MQLVCTLHLPHTRPKVVTTHLNHLYFGILLMSYIAVRCSVSLLRVECPKKKYRHTCTVCKSTVPHALTVTIICCAELIRSQYLVEQSAQSPPLDGAPSSRWPVIGPLSFTKARYIYDLEFTIHIRGSCEKISSTYFIFDLLCLNPARGMC